MKIGNREVSELNDTELILNFKNCLDAEEKRRQAATNSKFDKNNAKNVGSMPSANPAFIELKEALLNEITKRKLEI